MLKPKFYSVPLQRLCAPTILASGNLRFSAYVRYQHRICHWRLLHIFLLAVHIILLSSHLQKPLVATLLARCPTFTLCVASSSKKFKCCRKGAKKAHMLHHYVLHILRYTRCDNPVQTMSFLCFHHSRLETDTLVP